MTDTSPDLIKLRAALSVALDVLTYTKDRKLFTLPEWMHLASTIQHALDFSHELRSQKATRRRA